MADRKHIEQLACECAEQGQLIESGWLSWRLANNNFESLSPNEIQLLRNCFFAGARWLLSCQFELETAGNKHGFDVGMNLIERELNLFAQSLPTVGSA